MSESLLRERAAALGATFETVEDRSIPICFGDWGTEYQAVRQGAGIALRSDLGVLRLWGRDPVKMLQGLITNDLAGAPPHQGVYAVMLTAKGRTIAELRAFRLQREDGLEVRALVPAEAIANTREHLRKFIPPLYARWADASAEVGVIGVYGPRSRELVNQTLQTELPEMAEEGYIEPKLVTGQALVVRTRYAGGEDGYDLVAPVAELPFLWDELFARGGEFGVHPVGWDALEALRIEAGLPRYGMELTEEVIPTEAFEAPGLVPRAISFTKGCYTGQEVIIRIAHRGHVNRHLRGLLLGSAPAPAYRTALVHPESGKEIGWAASAAYSPLLAQTVALAYVRREVEPGSIVRVGLEGDTEATVATLPFATPTRANG